MNRNETRRDKDVIPVDTLNGMHAVVIGVGAIGGQVARQLAHIGIGEMTVIDPDTVGVENLVTQCFTEGDLGIPKVDAIAEHCAHINSDVTVYTHENRFNTKMLPDADAAIFMCVDDMTARATISKACAEERFVVDGRMTSEYMRILTFTDNATYKHYKGTLFSPDEAYRESCTAKATTYCANIAAGMMVSQFTKWLRGFPTVQDFELNILSLELYENAEDATS